MPVAAEPRIYDKLLQFLMEKDAPADNPCRVNDLPKEFNPSDPKNIRILQTAWVEGVIEFGHANHSFTGEPLHEKTNIAKPDKICILDDGFSWTGHRTNKHCTLRELLDRYKATPVCFTQKKIMVDKNTKECKVVRERVEGEPLSLRIRITDKGWGVLAE